MDSGVKQTRKLNPVESAGLFKRLTFLFTVPLFRKGEICESDIYQTVASYSTAALGNQLEAEWEKEKKRKDPWLLNPLISVFGRQAFLWGVLFIVIHSASMTAKPLLVRQIVSFYNPDQTNLTLKDGVVYCFSLVGCLCISNILMQFCMFRMDQLVQRIKISCSTLVYRKLIKSVANQNSRGQAITLLVKDINSADILLYCSYQIVLGILQIIIMGAIMYSQIGISAVIGLSWLLVYFPLQALLAKYAGLLRLRSAAITDRRLRETQEIFAAARVIKMYTWESFYLKAIEKVRRKEMAYMKLFRLLETIGFSLGSLSNKTVFCLSIVSYVSFGNGLTAEKVFTVTSCLGMLFGIIQVATPLAVSQFANFTAAMRRFSDFLTSEEVVARNVTQSVTELSPEVTVTNLTIKFGNVCILENINFRIENGLALVKGPTGTGKSTILLTLLSEVQGSSGTVDVKGIISYASQEPWLFPGTLKQNIIFGERYDIERYNTVVKVCNLNKDFKSFFNGDETYITDRGLNLSRGQKSRINLARCVYKAADIYLLDNCLSSLDLEVANKIFYQCVKSFLKNKICIMTTHCDTYRKHADHILELQHGTLTYQATKCQSETEKDDKSVSKFTHLEAFDNLIYSEKNSNEVVDSIETTKLLNTETNNKKIYDEFNEEGGVNKKVYFYYFSAGGGLWVFLAILLLIIIAQGIGSFTEYFMSTWVTAEQKLSGFKDKHLSNTTEYEVLEKSSNNMLFQYLGIVVGAITLVLISSISFLIFSCTAAVNIHDTILSKILKAAMQFFDRNLSGNVLTRFSRDLAIIDEPLPGTTFHTLQIIVALMAMLCMVSLTKPILIVPSSILLTSLYIARSFYLPTGRSIRRLEGSMRSPILGHLNATVDGLATIRANQMQPVLTKEFEQHQDVYNSVMFMAISTGCAFSYLLDTLSTIYIGAVTLTIMFFKGSLVAGQAGLVVTQAITISGTLLQLGIRLWADVENHMTSVERALAYTKTEPEEEAGQKPLNWPNNGKIVYKGVDLKYPLSGELVLKQVSFVLDAKEKLGVVGRTGAGKSSLISVLFRLYDFDGYLTIDAINIKELNLNYLRSKISIIPQDPFLFTGTIRENLDPQNEFTDKQLWEVLAEVEMKIVVDSLSEPITEGGNNFSIGQKQLICLARAILRKNIILVLDEATANIDPNTDATIQRTIKNNFSNCTVITIAHRISTILNSDKILVMDQGQVREFGSPKYLLSNKEGSFYKIVKEAGLNEDQTATLPQ